MKGYKKRARRLHDAMIRRNANFNHEGRREPDYLMNWQMDRLAEECSELIQAVMKVKRYPEDKIRKDNLYEELSHVKICSDIIMGFLGKGSFNDELNDKITSLENYYSEEIKKVAIE